MELYVKIWLFYVKNWHFYVKIWFIVLAHGPYFMWCRYTVTKIKSRTVECKVRTIPLTNPYTVAPRYPANQKPDINADDYRIHHVLISKLGQISKQTAGYRNSRLSKQPIILTLLRYPGGRLSDYYCICLFAFQEDFTIARKTTSIQSCKIFFLKITA